MVKFLLTHGSPRTRPPFADERYDAELEAVGSGSIEILEYLLIQTGELSTINEDDAAMLAAVKGHQTTMLKYLLSKGLTIPVSALTSLFETTLTLPPIEMVSLLLENGADPNAKHAFLRQTALGSIIRQVARDYDGWASLDHETALEMMKLLVSFGARFEHAVDTPNEVARSLCSTNESTKQYLLQQQPMLDAVDANLNSIIYFACANHELEVVQLLLDRGTDATPANPPAFRGAPLEELFHSLNRREGRSLEIVKLLLAHGDKSRFTTTCAVIELCDDSYRAPDVQCLRLPLDNDPSSAALFTYHGSTALHLASRAGNALCTKMLLDAGADVNAIETDEGLLPIEEAFEAGKQQTDDEELSPIDEAFEVGELTTASWRFSGKHATIIKLLLEYGSPIGRTELQAEHFVAIPELRKYIKG